MTGIAILIGLGLFIGVGLAVAINSPPRVCPHDDPDCRPDNLCLDCIGDKAAP